MRAGLAAGSHCGLKIPDFLVVMARHKWASAKGLMRGGEGRSLGEWGDAMLRSVFAEPAKQPCGETPAPRTSA